jgi:leucyl-tRNA synthetase
MEDKKINENLDGKKIIKTIVVPKKLVNLVVK